MWPGDPPGSSCRPRQGRGGRQGRSGLRAAASATGESHRAGTTSFQSAQVSCPAPPPPPPGQVPRSLAVPSSLTQKAHPCQALGSELEAGCLWPPLRSEAWALLTTTPCQPTHRGQTKSLPHGGPSPPPSHLPEATLRPPCALSFQTPRLAHVRRAGGGLSHAKGMP